MMNISIAKGAYKLDVTTSWRQSLIAYTYENFDCLKELILFFDKTNKEPYAKSIGPHVRHLVEHYEALLFGGEDPIDYDDRKRDSLLETSTETGLVRISALQRLLETVDPYDLDQSVNVRIQGGANGEYKFLTQSSVARELCFLNSHLVHHLAIIKPACELYKVPLSPNFGLAPSTVAYLLRN